MQHRSEHLAPQFAYAFNLDHHQEREEASVLQCASHTASWCASPLVERMDATMTSMTCLAHWVDDRANIGGQELLPGRPTRNWPWPTNPSPPLAHTTPRCRTTLASTVEGRRQNITTTCSASAESTIMAF
jgi:hypothetical protein